jgi:hypothetical protein
MEFQIVVGIFVLPYCYTSYMQSQKDLRILRAEKIAHMDGYRQTIELPELEPHKKLIDKLEGNEMED